MQMPPIISNESDVMFTEAVHPCEQKAEKQSTPHSSSFEQGTMTSMSAIHYKMRIIDEKIKSLNNVIDNLTSIGLSNNDATQILSKQIQEFEQFTTDIEGLINECKIKVDNFNL